MRVYADSSFILRLVTAEADSPQVVAAYRRLETPRLFFLPLHALEVQNAIRQRGFHQRRSLASGERQHVARERDAALARFQRLVARQVLLEVTLDMDAVVARATTLSTAHTERMGTRAIDLLHVAAALTLASELFLTADLRQSQLAHAQGLPVEFIG